MSKAGANFGLDLLWTILVSCLITYYLIVMFSRYTMVTGETIIQGIKEHIHPSVAIVLIIALSIVIVSALIGVLGIISEVLNEWIQTSFQYSLPTALWAAFISLGLYIVLWIGNYSFFEKLLAIFVAIMGTAFIATMLLNFPSVSELAQGLIPSIPESAQGSDNNSLIIITGMVGTTVSVFVFIIRSQIVKETGWKMSDDKIQKRDAFISASLMFLISAAVMITAATTLHVKGLNMNNVVEMIPLLEPIAGTAALSVFVIGIVAAGLSSHLPNLLVIPWLIIDYREVKRDTRTKTNRVILFVLSIIGVAGVALGLKPVFIMLLSQACLAVVLPITIGSIIYLTGKRNLMKAYINKKSDWIFLSAIMMFSLYMSGLGIRGLLIDLPKFLK